MKAKLPNVLIFVVVSALYLLGGMKVFDNQFTDLRFRLLQHDATDDIVLVRIDSASLQGLGVWPWPRRLHAEAIENLLAAGAQRIVVDLDLSSTSNEADDARLAEAIAAADARVVLPVFVQYDRPQDPSSLVFIEPAANFKAHATLASASVQPEPDGLVRRMSSMQIWKDGPIVTMAALLSGVAQVAPGDFYVDYGLRPQSVPQLSFINVLNGDFDPSTVAGRQVVIGATAIELGDSVPVPLWQALPGSMVQVLAAQSLLQGRALVEAPSMAIVLVVGLITLLIAPAASRYSWQANLAGVAALIAMALIATWVADAHFGILLEISPITLACGLCFAVTLALQIDEQKLRLLAQSFALRRQDRFLRSIVDHVFDGLMVIDADGAIRSFNPAASRMFGYAPEEIIGQPLHSLVDEGLWQASLGEGLNPAELTAKGRPQEVTGRRSDGSHFPIELAVTEMRGEDDTTHIVMARDISARKMAERVAAEAQTRLLQAIESMSEGFALFDASDRLVLCNSKLRDIYAPVAELLVPGWRYEDILRGLADLDLMPTSAVDKESWMKQRLHQHKDPRATIDEQMKDGCWYRIQEYRTAEQGSVLVVTDITSMKQRERLLEQSKDAADQANRAKTQFLANMSHELRTPLNAVIGFSEVILEEMLGAIGNAKYKEYAGDINSSATHLLDIINDILDISRIEAGKLEIHEENVELNAVIDTVLTLLQDQAFEGGISLTRVDAQPLPLLWADARLVRQMISNLVANAVRFTPTGGRVEVSARENDDGSLSVWVEDTGIGIAEADIARIMHPFEQASVGNARRFEGAGLGLPLVSSFARLHDGDLELTSELGRGTQAVVTFPAHRSRPKLRLVSA